MKWKQIALVLTTLSLLIVPLAWSQAGNAEQQLKKLGDQFAVAMLKADTNFFEKNLADDYIGIHSDGSLATKAQEIESFKLGAIKLEVNDILDRRIRVYEGTAITTALAFSKGTHNGKSFSTNLRVTRVWLKQKGTWKCASYQVTRVS